MRTLTPFAVVAVSVVAISAQQPVFRSTQRSVTVNVAVTRGNNPVAGLQLNDFHITDNGVAQKVDTVGFEAVPIDVSLFLDNSGSTHAVVERIKESTNQILKILRPGDRFRLLAFGFQVRSLTGWLTAGTTVDLAPLQQSRISSVYDAVFFAMMHRPDPGRRHLIVAITDAVDFASIVSLDDLFAVANRAEGVLHVMLVKGAGATEPNAPGRWLPAGVSMGAPVMDQIAEATGGRLHEPLFGDPVVQGFTKAFDDFRLSYVLTFTPSGVSSAGYHELKVTCPNQSRVSIRARKGYWGE
jgi:VWFA-related protein